MSVNFGAKPLEREVYLGDGLYASYDGYQFRLYASNGMQVTNEVFLDRLVFRAFIEYTQRCGA